MFEPNSNFLLLSRNRPAHKSFSSVLLDSNFLFKHMQPAHSLSDRDQARKHFSAGSKMHKRSQVLEILCINNQFVICLLENGRCSIHDLRKYPLY